MSIDSCSAMAYILLSIPNHSSLMYQPYAGEAEEEEGEGEGEREREREREEGEGEGV